MQQVAAQIPTRAHTCLFLFIIKAFSLSRPRTFGDELPISGFHGLSVLQEVANGYEGLPRYVLGRGNAESIAQKWYEGTGEGVATS